MSANGTVHGLRAERVVLAHEDAATYTAHVQAWMDALVPGDEAELELVVSIADCRWRVQRMDAVEMNRQRAEVLAQLDETPEHAFLVMVQDVATATQAMAETLAAVQIPSMEVLSALLSPNRGVIDMVLAVERERVGVQLGSAALDEAVSNLTTDVAVGELDSSALDELRAAARASAEAAATLLATARGAVEKVEEKLAATVPLPDDKQQALLTRYRKDVERRLVAEMALLTAVRERKVQVKTTAGSLGQPIPVAIRLVG